MNVENRFSLSALNQTSSFFDVDFPVNQKLILDEIEAITTSAFRENFKSAQSVNLPYYLVSLVKSKAEKKSDEFKIYDTISFRAYLTLCKQKNVEPIDPLSRYPVEKIYFFALECFDSNYNPIELPKTVELSAYNFFDPRVYDADHKDWNLAIDALDYETLLKRDLDGNVFQEEIDLIKEIQQSIVYECFRAYEVAKNIVSVDNDINEISDEEQDVTSGNFTKSMDEEIKSKFRNVLVSSGGDFSQGFLNSSNSASYLFENSISSISEDFEERSFFGKTLESDSFENASESDNEQIQMSGSHVNVKRLKDEWNKWLRALNFGQEGNSSLEASGSFSESEEYY